MLLLRSTKTRFSLYTRCHLPPGCFQCFGRWRINLLTLSSVKGQVVWILLPLCGWGGSGFGVDVLMRRFSPWCWAVWNKLRMDGSLKGYSQSNYFEGFEGYWKTWQLDTWTVVDQLWMKKDKLSWLLNEEKNTPAAEETEAIWQLQVLTWMFYLFNTSSFSNIQWTTTIPNKSMNFAQIKPWNGGITKSNQQNSNNSKNHGGNKHALYVA